MKTDSYNGKNVRDLSSIFSAKAEKMAEELLASKSGKSFSQFLGSAGKESLSQMVNSASRTASAGKRPNVGTINSFSDDYAGTDKVSSAAMSYKNDVSGGRKSDCVRTKTAVKTSDNDDFRGGSDRVVKESGNDGTVKNDITDNSQDKKETVLSKDDQVSGVPLVKDPDRREPVDDAVNAISQIAGALKEVLDVTDEDIFEAMEVLGLSVADLFEHNDLKELFIELSGAEDTMDFLTDASLYQGVTKVLENADDVSAKILNDFNITEEDFKLLLSDVSEIADYGTVLDESFTNDKHMVLPQPSYEEKNAGKPAMGPSAAVILKDDGNGAVLQQTPVQRKDTIKGSDILSDDMDELSKELTDGKPSAASEEFLTKAAVTADALVLKEPEGSVNIVLDPTVKTDLQPEGKIEAADTDEALDLAVMDTEDEAYNDNVSTSDNTVLNTPKIEIEDEKTTVIRNPYQRKNRIELSAAETDSDTESDRNAVRYVPDEVKAVSKNESVMSGSDNKNRESGNSGGKNEEMQNTADEISQKREDEPKLPVHREHEESSGIIRENHGNTGSSISEMASATTSAQTNSNHLNALFQPVINNIQDLVRIKEDVFAGYTDIRQAREIVKQIVEQVKITASAETTSMELELNPASLGHLSLNIEQKNGMVTASIITQNEAVKDAIAGQIQVLHDSLEEQGIKVEAVEVTVESHAFEQNMSQNSHADSQELARREIEKSARHRRIVRLLAGGVLDSDSSEGDGLQLDMMRRGGNSMDILA